MAELSVKVKNGKDIDVDVQYKGELSAEVLLQIFEGFKSIEHKSSTGNNSEKKVFEN